MGGLKKFHKSLMGAMTPDLASSMTGDSEESKKLREALKNHIFDLPGPRYVYSTLTARRKHLTGVFRGFSEVWLSLETLDDIQFLLGRFPFRGTRITGERYLQLHVEAYLGEIYLFKVRLDRFLTMLLREYRGDPRLHEFQHHAASLSKLVNASLKPMLDARNAHIHEARFKDDGISRLGTIGLLTREGDGEFVRQMRAIYRAGHAKEKRRLKKIVATNRRAVRQLVDAYFSYLYPLLFDTKTGGLRVPSRLRP
jgi:hypothetical protein